MIFASFLWEIRYPILRLLDLTTVLWQLNSAKLFAASYWRWRSAGDGQK